MPYMGIYQIKDGRIWRARDYFDMAGYLGMTKGDANPWLLKVVETMTERPWPSTGPGVILDPR